MSHRKVCRQRNFETRLGFVDLPEGSDSGHPQGCEAWDSLGGKIRAAFQACQPLWTGVACIF